MASAAAIINSNTKRSMSYKSLCGFMLFVIFLLCSWGALPQQVSAHASMTQSVPAANAELVQSPPSVVLTFNERLEDGVYYVKVFDSKQKLVTDNKAKINATHTAVELALPALATGNYIVTYHVISADGHPVEGTYLFAVGQSLTQQPGAAPSNMEHLHSHSGLSGNMGIGDIVNYISRVLYYISMLFFTGWVIWLRFGQQSIKEARPVLGGWAVQLQRIYLIVFLIFMFTHIYGMIGDGGPEAMAALFTSTSTGYIWIACLVWSLLGFVILFRNVWLDMLWVVLLWLFKSLNGHAAAFAPQSQTILLDVIHLAAAALWMGGLLMLLVLWRRNKEEAAAFFPRFSSAALGSIVILVVSGVFTVMIFLQDIRYVVETQWGKLLLVKSALVLLVALTGVTLRVIYRKHKLQKVGTLLRIDAALAILIAGIVGVFTYLTPLPANEPLYWHVMGEKIHMTAQITPNVPGVNDITVKVWLPEKLGKPKQVLMKLRNKGTPEIAPIEVPLSFTEEPVQFYEESYGMKKNTYKAHGAYLPYPGNWDIEIRVMDSNDDETVYEKQIKLY